MSEIFISYARSTEAEARKIAEALRALGYGVWRDDELPAHRDYSEVIEERLRSAKAVVVIWSADAVKSQWVRAEADIAREAATMVQLSLDGAARPMPFNRVQCADMTGWTGDVQAPGWRKVVASVAELIGRAPTGPTDPAAPITAPGLETARTKVRLGRRAWVAGGLAVLLLAAAGGAWWLIGRGSRLDAVQSVRVAVLPFAAPAGDAKAEDFAVGLADEILGVVSANGQQAISRTEAEALRGAERDQTVRRLGVGLMLDGEVQSEGGRLRVRVHLDDAQNHVTLWSKDFEGAADRPAALQAQVAAVATDIADWALIARRSARTPLDATTMIAFLQGSDLLTSPGTREKVESTLADFRLVTQRAPGFAVGHANLALALSDASGASAGGEDEGRTEANRAIALDPRSAAAYMALAELEPRQHWRERAALLTKAVEADPGFSFAPLFESRFLTEVGRFADALPLAERSVALRPLFPGGNATLGHLLVLTGDADGARKVLDKAAARWPDNDRTKIERLQAAIEVDDMDGALVLLADPDTRPPTVSGAQAAVWRAALQARKSGDANAMRTAAAQVWRGADPSVFGAAAAFGLCALLADLDCAFAEADRWAANPVGADIGLLYSPTTRTMRRDPRFMALAARLGLVEYWRSTGRWPDFCAEPGLPYDCKVEATRLAPKRPS